MSTSNRFTLRAAVYLLIIKKGKILLLRRFNTGWRDGEYTLPAGHIDGNESIRSELCREAQEEVGVTIQPSLQFIHVMHQRDNYEYIDFYFIAKTWKGTPANREPEKCDGIQWATLDKLPENIIPNVKQALQAYKTREFYSEFVLE